MGNPCCWLRLAGAIQQLQGWGCSLCCWGGPTTRDGEGVYQGEAKKQGVSLARGIGLYTHIPSPLSENWRGSVWGSVGVPSGGGWRKKGWEDFPL